MTTIKCVRHKDYDHAILSGLEYAEGHLSSHKCGARDKVFEVGDKSADY